jgi:hypothetical protein
VKSCSACVVKLMALFMFRITVNNDDQKSRRRRHNLTEKFIRGLNLAHEVARINGMFETLLPSMPWEGYKETTVPSFRQYLLNISQQIDSEEPKVEFDRCRNKRDWSEQEREHHVI